MRQSATLPLPYEVWPPGTLLGRLSPAVRDELLDIGVRRRVEVATVILREGENGSHVVLLHDTFAKVTAQMSDGRQALLAVRVSGDLVGETSALNHTPRSASVVACRAGVVIIVTESAFRSFLRRRPDAALEVAGIVADRLRWSNRRRVDFASYPVKVRLARVLAEMADSYGERTESGLRIGVKFSQSELATLCGAADVTLRKAMGELRGAHVVRIDNRYITVCDPDGLHRIGQLHEF